jgi:benzil reductase ((S)-benzoin forming)
MVHFVSEITLWANCKSRATRVVRRDHRGDHQCIRTPPRCVCTDALSGSMAPVQEKGLCWAKCALVWACVTGVLMGDILGSTAGSEAGCDAVPAAAWIIITGHSRGMGHSIAAQALREGTCVLGISRKHAGPLLLDIARDSGATLEEWQYDLADGEVVAERLRAWLGTVQPSTVTSIALINNAAMLSRPAPLQAVPPAELVAALRVGLEAPVLLTQAFLAATESWRGTGWMGGRRVLQISSGLGRSAMASLGSYCAVKAGLDNFAASVALDQQQLGDSGAKIVSLDPGIIATDMQVQLRNAEGTGFPDQSMFVRFHENGVLKSPESAAAKVLGYLSRPDFGSTVIARL